MVAKKFVDKKRKIAPISRESVPAKRDFEKAKKQLDDAENPVEKEPTYTIYVGNLNYRRTEQGLADLFRKYGNVVKVTMLKRTGSDLKMGIAFVQMSDPQQAARAIAGLNGAQIDGRSLKVSQANEYGKPVQGTWTASSSTVKPPVQRPTTARVPPKDKEGASFRVHSEKSASLKKPSSVVKASKKVRRGKSAREAARQDGQSKNRINREKH